MTTRGTRGRPTKITQELIEQIASTVRAGIYLETAAACAGISKDTLFRWLRRGARERKRIETSPRARPKKSEALYCAFSEAIARALAEAEATALALIDSAAAGAVVVLIKEIWKEGELAGFEICRKQLPPQWQAAAWRLERRFPQRWGKRKLAQAQRRTIASEAGEKGNRLYHQLVLKILGDEKQPQPGQ